MPCKFYPSVLDTLPLLADSKRANSFLGFAGAIMSAIYEEKKDEDGFLYVTYSGENTFGDQISK